jgi:hypothetical protein
MNWLFVPNVEESDDEVGGDDDGQDWGYDDEINEDKNFSVMEDDMVGWCIINLI